MDKQFRTQGTKRRAGFVIEILRNKMYSKLDNAKLVEVNPKSPEYHARMLATAVEAEQAAYHIIAIGILGQETPEVRSALEHAFRKFNGVGVPQGYDWPDLAEKTKQKLQEEGAIYRTDIYPGARWIAMTDLIVECDWRLQSAKKAPEKPSE